ncbi:RNA polymerase sigma factor (sigma-70 family) [Streptomyces pseudovenezuelae]|uniref:RNA polymerase sigma factor (Sigma-70 family) n=1 Tax=Streptomyces pseudovenezuelae TaxID=67350 RepID=A0ABT6M2M9_9ACTN|nr:RNA polymerase sigma factor (sigma-70 family) [Streptomyces pseudovenezuelae]
MWVGGRPRRVVDEAALGAFYAEHIGGLQTYLTRKTGPDTARELASQVFEQFLVWWPDNPSHPAPVAALYRIAQCRLVDHLRRQGRAMALDVPDLEQILALSGVEDDVAAVDLHVDLERALAELTRRQQEALQLRYVAELPVGTCAEVLGLGIDNMKKILKNVLRTLRDSPRMAAYDNTTRAREVQQ